MVQKFFQTYNLFYWRFGETLGVAEVRDALLAINRTEEGSDLSFVRFFDMSLVKKVDLQLSDVSKIARERRASLPKMDFHSKSAIYAPSNLHYELANLYKTFLGDTHIQLGIFQEICDAENWLKISLDKI